MIKYPEESNLWESRATIPAHSKIAETSACQSSRSSSLLTEDPAMGDEGLSGTTVGRKISTDFRMLGLIMTTSPPAELNGGMAERNLSGNGRKGSKTNATSVRDAANDVPFSLSFDPSTLIPLFEGLLCPSKYF